MTIAPLRRSAASLSLAALAAGLVPTAAHGAAATRIDAEYWSVDCVYALPGNDTLFLFASGTTDGAEGGVGAFVEDTDGAIVAEGQTDSYTFGDDFTTSFALGEGTLGIDVAVTRGETRTEPLRERSGNSWTRGTMTMADLDTLTQSLTYAGRQVDVSSGSCAGSITGFDVLTTNPAATIYRDEDFDSEICDVAGLPDAQVRITGQLPNTVVEVVADHGESGVEKLAGDLTLTGGRGSLSGDVVDLFTGEVTTTGTVTLDLTRTGRQTRQVESADGFTERRRHTTYREEIAVAFADGRRGAATCTGVATTTHVWIGPGR